MSSDPKNHTETNNTQTRRMGSIQRRLSAAWAGKRFGRIFWGSVLLLILGPAVYLGIREYAALGTISFRTERSFSALRGADGALQEVIYRAEDTFSGLSTEFQVWQDGRRFLIAVGVLFLLRLLWMLCVSLPAQKRRNREILAP